jgi:hypothetical protein
VEKFNRLVFVFRQPIREEFCCSSASASCFTSLHLPSFQLELLSLPKVQTTNMLFPSFSVKTFPCVWVLVSCIDSAFYSERPKSEVTNL